MLVHEQYHHGLRCIMMFLTTNITFERPNKLFSKQIREKVFNYVQRGMPKSFMMKPYLGIEEHEKGSHVIRCF